MRQFVLDFNKADTKTAKLQITENKHAHLDIAKRERVKMQEHFRFALDHPEELHMVFVDYSTALKLPHFQRCPDVRLSSLLSVL